MPIPKIIHYCWFGGAEKPAIVKKCVESWSKYMPDYEIVEWNESNYDVHKIPFVDEAYQAKKWAFVSDYARFDVINQYGGIYFDTDVELIKPIPEEIMSKSAFTGMESAGKVNPGLIFASVPETVFLKDILNSYNHSHFKIGEKVNYKTVNMFTTEILEEHGYCYENHYQEIYGLAIYPSEYFCGYDQDVHEVDIREDTISVHHYAGTWTETSLKCVCQKICKRLLGVEPYRKLLMLKRKLKR